MYKEGVPQNRGWQNLLPEGAFIHQPQGLPLAPGHCSTGCIKHDNEQITAKATEGVNHLRVACLQPYQVSQTHHLTMFASHFWRVSEPA